MEGKSLRKTDGLDTQGEERRAAPNGETKRLFPEIEGGEAEGEHPLSTLLEAQAELKRVNRLNIALQHEIHDLQEQLRLAKGDAPPEKITPPSELYRELKCLEEENALRKEEITQLKNDLVAKESAYEALRKKYRHLLEQPTCDASGIADKEHATLELERMERERLEAELERLQRRYEKLERLHESNETQRMTLEAIRKAQAEENARLQAERDAARAKVTELEATVTSLEAALSSFHVTLGEDPLPPGGETEMAGATAGDERRAFPKTAPAPSGEEPNDLIGEIDRLKREVAFLTEERQEIMKILSEPSDGTNDTGQDPLAAARKVIEHYQRIRSHCETMDLKVEDLERQLLALAEENADLRNRISTDLPLFDQLCTQIAGLEQDLEQEKALRRELEIEIEKFRKERFLLVQQNADLLDRLAASETKGETKRFGFLKI
ncbi:MAG: hypothetical protein D6812_08065 [Deltaproteobacteria bacterium]|nr:MAG: hypothetical protein D6812_08065 [Deltaproteobacteria bacterium]